MIDLVFRCLLAPAHLNERVFIRLRIESIPNHAAPNFRAEEYPWGFRRHLSIPPRQARRG
jgi:hypothetical protein